MLSSFFSSSDIELFSKRGLAKFQDLRDKLISLQKKIFEDKGSSEYSQIMITTVIEIIDLITRNNNIHYWSKGSNRSGLIELTDKLDGEKGIFVPEVFNAQSWELAKTLLKAIQEINLNEDLNGAARAALNQLTNPEKLIKTLISNLNYKIRFFEMLKNNETESANMKLVSKKMDQEFGSIYAEASTITAETYADFQKKYKTLCNQWIEEINLTPNYLRICNPGQFVNLDKPCRFDLNDLVSAGNRVRLIVELFSLEKYLNAFLLKSNHPIIHHAYDCYSLCFSQNAYSGLEKSFKSICLSLNKELNSYKKGDHLSIFQSIDDDKVKCVDFLLDELKKSGTKLSENKTSIGMESFEIFKSILGASYQNENIASEKKKSLGELSKILNRYAISFFQITFNQVNQTNDTNLLRQFDSYKQEFNISLRGPDDISPGLK
jgi:hypothetical protein